MKQEYIIKRNIFGGFNRTDVINCLVNLTKDTEALKQHEINSLKNRIEDLNRETEKRCIKINEYLSITNISTLKAENTDAVHTADELLDDAKREVENIKKGIRIYINSVTPKIEHIQSKSSTAKEILSRLQSNLHQLSEKLDSFDFENTNETKTEEIQIQAPIPETAIILPIEETKITENISESIEIPPEEETTEEIIIAEEIDAIEEIVDPTVDIEQNDSFNSIDNFFAEMDKLIAKKKNPEPYLSVINENPIEHLE